MIHRDNKGRFIKGGTSVNKGKIFSQEWRKKLSDSHKGIVPVTAFKKGNKTGAEALKRWREKGGQPWNKGIPHKDVRGENHWNWQGGKTAKAEYIRFTFEYRQWRKFVFEKDNYTCQECGLRGGRLQADHIKPQSSYPELRFDVENGRTLCKDCHKATPTWGYGAIKIKAKLSNENIGG